MGTKKKAKRAASKKPARNVVVVNPNTIVKLRRYRDRLAKKEEAHVSLSRAIEVLLAVK